VHKTWGVIRQIAYSGAIHPQSGCGQLCWAARTVSRWPVPASSSSSATPTLLHPAARLLWRSANEAQIEIGTRRVVLDGIGTDAVRRLIGRGAGAGGDPALPTLQARLVEAGYLWTDTLPREPDPTASDARRTVAHPRLAGELTALSARAGERAAELVAARRHCTVVVHGTGRVGPYLAGVLAAAGVGRVHAVDSVPARLHHAMPGGLTPGDEGTPFAAASAAAAERQAPDVVCVPAPFGEPPDLVVLAVDEPVDEERRAALHARSCAHLLVRVSGGHGVVGPLVLPGLTSCLRCADLHRLDRDPAWNALAVQLTLPHRAAVASEVALATVIAGLAAVQALDFLDGGRPATIEGSLEMHLPDWRLRRRTWPVHPECDCMLEASTPAGLPGPA
jgi:bacteriocin biosynthesis cyclodehydratase domain-containing protein